MSKQLLLVKDRAYEEGVISVLVYETSIHPGVLCHKPKSDPFQHLGLTLVPVSSTSASHRTPATLRYPIGRSRRGVFLGSV